MTTYGTIPSEPPISTKHLFVSHAKERIKTGLGTRRPWMEMISLSHFRFPSSSFELIQRIKINASFFRVNYVIVILFLLFLTLLWHPISMIVFIVMMIAWLFLYFLRDEPLVVSGYLIPDRVVMLLLLMITVGILFLTNVTDNVIAGLSVGALAVLVHAVLRETEDTYFVDEEARVGSGGGEVVKVPLRNAASSSFTLS